MKQILLMIPSYYNFDEVIRDGLLKYSDYGINSIDTSFNKAYRNIFERGLNFLSKVFLNKNLKPEMRRRLILDLIDKFSEYDYLIVNRADIIHKDILEKAIKKSKKAILLLWDSQDKIPTAKETIEMFDTVYSFDKEDCDKYGFQKIENFHFFETPLFHKIKYDAVFFGSLDSRIKDLKTLLNYLDESNKKGHAYISIPYGKELVKYPNIEILPKIIPYKNSYKYTMSGSIVIDLGHENQSGLSFRFFEAMAFKKKIITTNKKVVHYDFYNENNIFIIEDINNLFIPASFWETSYEELPINILEKYHIKNWVKRILN